MNEICNRICITPTRNESWIIKHFLAAAKFWASHIIVADQGSTDGTLRYLQEADGVDVIVNDSPVYDESRRQQLLIARARRIAGRRVLLALDADEALSANCLRSKEWAQISEAKPGTVLRFRWVNILPGFEKAWIAPEPLPCGFIDDASEHKGTRIHSPRVPQPANAPIIDLEDVVVLHFQYVVWQRMVSKHRWYEAWDYTANRQKKPLQIFRQYHHMYGSWEKSEIHPVKPEWLAGYNLAGVEYTSLKSEPITWWDEEVVQMLRKYGPRHFRKLSIWNQDWNMVARRIGLTGVDLADPRSSLERMAHRLLAITQNHRTNLGVRAFERLLRAAGW